MVVIFFYQPDNWQPAIGLQIWDRCTPWPANTDDVRPITGSAMRA